MELTVSIDDKGLRRRLAFVSSDRTMARLNGFIGNRVLDHTKDFLDVMASRRHKCADRLGAPHSKFLEYASGRLGGSPLNQTTDLAKVSDKGATIAIKNTPGLSRAFHDLHISAKRAKALTIPIDRISHDKRVADLRREGVDVFRPKGTNILAMNEETGRGGKKKQKLRPLYALVRSVTVPKDEGLLPSNAEVREWSKDATEAFFENEDL